MSGECDECGQHATDCECFRTARWKRKKTWRKVVKIVSLGIVLLFGVTIFTFDTWDDIARKILCGGLGLLLGRLYVRSGD